MLEPGSLNDCVSLPSSVKEFLAKAKEDFLRKWECPPQVSLLPAFFSYLLFSQSGQLVSARLLLADRRVFVCLHQSTTCLDDFGRLKTLGTGSFGRVMLVKHKATEQYFAMKILEKQKVSGFCSVARLFLPGSWE